MPSTRSRGRNVWIEFSSAPGHIQGGLRAPSNLTATQFLDMLHVVFSAPGGFYARLRDSNTPLIASNQLIEYGYYILTPHLPGHQMQTCNERFFQRTLSLTDTRRDVAFRDQVRERDGRCVITHQINHDADYDEWFGFEAAHIFPLALDPIFISHGFSQLITHNHPPGINSPQNGLLLQSHIHQLWDNYVIAVNPHDGYKVQAFSRTAWQHHGKVLHPTCRQSGNPTSVVDALLRWHYEQAVLCNMRGAGEPAFEHDFPLGTDMMGEIREGPQPAERMETELFSRLYGYGEA
ncbi:hypothetical protein MW887_010302 [Aspergillus wentii]|nr:hypothetical protein MW887_010302 [Aspergillus wentii]